MAGLNRRKRGYDHDGTGLVTGVWGGRGAAALARQSAHDADLRRKVYKTETRLKLSRGPGSRRTGYYVHMWLLSVRAGCAHTGRVRGGQGRPRGCIRRLSPFSDGMSGGTVVPATETRTLTG